MNNDNNKNELPLKVKILELREKGLSYRQIQKELNCSMGSISFHLNADVRERSKFRKNCYKKGVEFERLISYDKVPCKHCGVELKNRKSIFCSANCSNEFTKEEIFQKFIQDIPVLFDNKAILRYLIKWDGEYKCSICGVSEWQGKKISLQVDHINGDSSDNRSSNLRILCPNCHSQTDTWGRKNIGRGRRSLKRLKESGSVAQLVEQSTDNR